MRRVLTPLGITAAMLRDGVTRMLPVPVLQKRLASGRGVYWGPLFAQTAHAARAPARH